MKLCVNALRIAGWLCVLLSVFFGCNLPEQTPDNRSKDAVIFGGSMASTLLGAHFECRCLDCGFDFRFDAASAPKLSAVCPNCGAAENSGDQWITTRADHVEVDQVENPATLNRFDIVAFRYPERDNEFGVKRIVGLPGEKVEIRNGDVYIDGQIVRKSLEDQQTMAILVFDSSHRSDAVLRWSPVDETKAWNTERSHIEFVAPDRTDEPASELKYVHVRGYRGLGTPRDVDAVEDFYAYNQTTVRTLNRVRDLAVSFDLSAKPDSKFVVGFDHLSERVSVSFAVKKAVKKSMNSLEVEHRSEGEIAIVSSTLLDASTACRVYVSIFDGQLLVAVNGEPLITKKCEIPLADQP